MSLREKEINDVPRSARVQEMLRRINALLSSVSGLDRVMMLIQYAGPLLGYALTKSTPYTSHLVTAGGNSKAIFGARRAALSSALTILSGKLSDARMLMRFAGLFPILSWALSLEKTRGNSRAKNLQRAQVWSMLAYYPLEHIYYLAAHNIISLQTSKKLKAVLWACRAWGAYVVIQLVLLSYQARALSSKVASLSAERRRSATSSKSYAAVAAANTTEREKSSQENVNTDVLVEQAGQASEDADLVVREQECIKESKVLRDALTANLAYAPMTVHWSLEQGLFGNPIWSNVFMSIAGAAGLKANWRNTA